MQIPQATAGARLKISNKNVPFGLWPTKEGGKGNHSLQSMLFALDPWAIIKLAIEEKCPATAREEALAYIAQAEDFYGVATENVRIAARPLSVYYCFMNLVKAFCLTRGTQPTFNKARHGLSEQLDPPYKELSDAYLEAFPSPNNGALQNFSEFKNALTGQQLSARQRWNLPELLPQILPGHRLWAHAANKKERFLAFHDIQFWADATNKTMWLNLYALEEDIDRLDMTRQEFLQASRLDADFAQVKCLLKTSDGRDIVCFEQKVKKQYTTSKPANTLAQLLVEPIRHSLWTTVASVPPYRRYYAYTCPPVEIPAVVTQLLSVYAVSYYLGSITRYRPHHFDKLVKGSYGPRIQDFVTGQPLQFLYLMASEFSKQDIAKPSII